MTHNRILANWRWEADKVDSVVPFGYSMSVMLLSVSDIVFKEEFSKGINGSAKVPLNRLESKYLANAKITRKFLSHTALHPSK